MSLAPNQLLMYDTAMSDWVLGYFKGVISQPLTLMVGTPDRAFAEYLTVTTTPRDGRPPLPRAALTIGDPVRDPERFNSATIRKLGYADSDNHQIYRGHYPIPVNIPYTLNFWTEKYRDMNMYVQQGFSRFRLGYTPLSVDIDSISPTPLYGSKLLHLHLDGDFSDTGDVEPGNKERVNRRTANLILKGWIWDLNYEKAYTLKEVEFQSYDIDRADVLMSVVRTPQRETLNLSPDGSTTSFGPIIPYNAPPIIQGTLLVDAVIGGEVFRGRDNGEGVIADPVSSSVTGTVNYTTGSISLNYATAPDNGSEITAGFYTTLD